MEDKCVSCGEIIPEGRQICPECEASRGKLCPICREYKSLAEYHKRMRNGRNVGQAYCKACQKVIDRNNHRLRREMMKHEI